jgi:hypothetical protein
MPSVFRTLNEYRLVYIPDHPRTLRGTGYEGYVYEHIIVAEHMLGRSLRQNEVVHHLDFDRSNNLMLNLLVLETTQHTKLHEWLASGAPGWKHPGENRVNSRKATGRQIYCLGCAALLSKRQKKFCSKKCSASVKQRRKVTRPSKEQLAMDLACLSWCAVGRKYGVTDNAIRKWAKAYGLSKPTLSQAQSTL